LLVYCCFLNCDSFLKEKKNVMRLIKLVPVVGLCAASFLPVSVAAGEYQYKNDGSGLCLDATAKRDDAFVQQASCAGQDGQKWQMVDKGWGTFWLKNKWTGTCLDVYALKYGEYPMLNTVTTSQCADWKLNQKWENISRGRIKNAHTSQCLAAPGDLKLGPVKVVGCNEDGSYLKWEKK
jgi:hypothetical protein